MSKVKIACLLLAAGKSERMKPDHKLLMKMGDFSVIKKTALEIVQSQFCEVIAVTGFKNAEVERELVDLPIKIVHNDSFEKGLHSSIKLGVKNLSLETEFFAVCLADQPALTHVDYNRLIEAVNMYPDKKLFHPSFKGKKGNPAIIARDYIPEIISHEDNDRGCFYLFEKHSQVVVAVEMFDASALMDIDTPALFDEVQFHIEKRS